MKKLKVYRLSKQLETVTDEQLSLNVTPVITFEGVYVRRALLHFSEWFLMQTFEKCWSTFKELYWDNFVKQITTQLTNFDPTKNYDYTETRTRTRADGDETKTRTPDNTQNYTETTSTYNNTKTVEAGAGNNALRTDTYSIVYDTDPKHTSYTTTTGRSTETNQTNGTGDKVKTVDNLKYTETKSHSELTKTIDGKTYSGDMIENESIHNSGFIKSNVAEQIKAKIELYKTSYIDEFIRLFIDKYAFFVGGENYEFNII